MQVVQEKREYQRILPSQKSIDTLESKGFEWVFSSNVSAATVRGLDLIIRFHNGSIYSYTNKGKDFERLMGAASKGKWVWRFLRRPNVPYAKIGSLPLAEDTDETDTEIIKPRIPTYKVSVIVPTDIEKLAGKLPQIKISPLKTIGASDIPLTQDTKIMTMADVTLEPVTIELEETKLVIKTNDTVKDMEDNIYTYLKDNSPIKKVEIVNEDEIQVKILERSVEQLNNLNKEYNSSVDGVRFGRVDLKNAYGQCSGKLGNGTVRIQFNATDTIEHLTKEYKSDVVDSKRFNNFHVIVDEENIDIYTMTHEYGHSFHTYDANNMLVKFMDKNDTELLLHNEIKKVKSDYKRELKKLSNGMMKARMGDTKDEVEYKKLLDRRNSIYISNYANTNTDEWIAEAFTDAKLSSNPSPYSVRLLNSIDKYKKGSD